MEAIREILDPYVYVLENEAYLKRDDPLQTVKKKTMDAMLADKSYFARKGLKLASSTEIALSFNLVEKVMTEVYDAEKERITTEYINVYKKPEWARTKETAPPAVLAKHFERLIPVDFERAHFIKWLAYNVQYPSRKVHHAVLLYSMETGVGKSYFQQLLAKLIGETQVFVIEQGQLLDNFTDWQARTSLIFFHELYEKRGQNVETSLKSRITEKTTTVRRPYQGAVNIPNTYNVLACTNHIDSLKIDARDRRWFIVNCVGGNDDKYYDKLYGMLEDKEGLEQAYNYFMNMDLSSFNPYAKPPVTSLKESMIEASEGDFEGWLRLAYIRKEGIFKDDMLCLRYMPLVPKILSQLPANFGKVEGITPKVHTFLNSVKKGKRIVRFKRDPKEKLETATVYFIRNEEYLEKQSNSYFIHWLKNEVLAQPKEALTTDDINTLL